MRLGLVSRAICLAAAVSACSANGLPGNSQAAIEPGIPAVSLVPVTDPAGPSTTAAEPTTTVAKIPLDRTLGAGMVGEDVRALQQRLNDLKFDVGKVDGEFGIQTTQAVWAYQKLILSLAGRDVTGKVSPDMWSRIQDPLGFGDLRPNATSRHLLVFLPAQTAVLFEQNKVRLITHVSSGDGDEFCYEPKIIVKKDVPTTTLKPGTVGPATTRAQRKCGVSLTPGGTYKVYFRESGWQEIPLGTVHNPLYFNGGIALHGAKDVPNRPASHGCVRVPMHISEYLPSLIRNGDDVFVFDGKKEPEFYGPQPPPIDVPDPSDTTVASTTTSSSSTTSSTTTTTLAKTTVATPVATTLKPPTSTVAATTTAGSTTTTSIP